MEDSIARLEAELHAAVTVQDRIDALNELAWASRRDDMDRAFALSAEAIDLSQDSKNFDPPYFKGVVAGMTAQIGVTLYRDETEQALAQALEAVALADKYELTTLLPRLLYVTAVAHSELGDLTNALEYALRQQTISEELGDKEGKAIGLISLTVSYADQGDYEHALESCLLGVETFRELNDVYNVVLQLSNASEIYGNLGDYDNALKMALQCLDTYRYAESVHPRTEIVTLHKIGDAYVGLQQYEKAQSYLEESLALAENSEHQSISTDVLITLARLHNTLNQPEKAILYASRAVVAATKYGHQLPLYHAHHMLADSYRLLQNYEKALEHYTTFHDLKETVFNDENRKRLRTLEVLHHTREAQKEAAYYASLYQIEQNHRHLAEVLNRVGKVLNGTLELSAVLDHVLEQLGHLVGFNRGSVLLLHESTLEFVAARGYPVGHAPAQYQVPINIYDEHDVFVRIWKSKQPLALTDLANDPGWTKVSELPIPDAWLGVPLIHHDEVIGILSLARTTPRPYDQDEVTLAMTFGAQAAAALENAQLYAQISLMNEQLEDEVHARTEDLHIANEELMELNRTKTDFITITAHELRTPVTVLKGYGQILQKDPVIVENESQSHLVAGIVNGANRMHEVVNRMLLMVKIDSHQLKIYPEPIIARMLIGDVIRLIKGDLDNRTLTFNIDNDLMTLPPFDADKDMLKTVFTNLILNAIKYTPDGGSIRINGRFWTHAPADNLPEQAVEITITDTGIGIEKDALGLIFGKMYQTGTAALHSSGKTKFKGGGSGLGLAIARGIVTAHNGRIWADSDGYDEETLPGSTFHVVLPIAQPIEP
jgi:signal transduction histidine kinase/cell fate (sporulation/competence/biofilm development) regulator YlbF (YheA/YmcA/DUF963 family)